MKLEIDYRFNSCMVQLKLNERQQKTALRLSFNSCMVQLKLAANTVAISPIWVLIPVWCN